MKKSQFKQFLKEEIHKALNKFEERYPKGTKVEVDGVKGVITNTFSMRGNNFEQYDIKLVNGKELEGVRSSSFKVINL
jgi:hypothetical protein